jgi:hypothetical protein
LKNWDREAWTGFIWLRKGTGYCKWGNESWGSVKCWVFID